MAAKTKNLTDILGDTRSKQSESAKLEEDKRPNDKEEIQKYTSLVVAGRKEYERFLQSWHQHPEYLVSPFLDDTRRAFFCFNCFHFGDQMIKKFTEWRRADPGGVAPEERRKRIASLNAEVAAGWREACDLIDQLQAQGSVIDWPGDTPPEVFLEWNGEKISKNGHRRFLELHKRAEGQRGQSDAYRTTIETITLEERTLRDRLTLMENNSLTPAKQIEDVQKSLERCREMRQVAQIQRDKDSRAVNGSIALYALCLQFFRDKGVQFSQSFLLLGEQSTIEPYVERGPARVTPLSRRHVVV